LSGFDKNLSQASKIFFGCRNGEIILIPTYYSAPSILLQTTLEGTNAGGAMVLHDAPRWPRHRSCIRRCALARRALLNTHFLPVRTRLVASSGNGRFELWTIPLGQRQRKNNQYCCHHAHPCPRSQSASADRMDSKTLRTSDPPHQGNDNMIIPKVGCVWKISGEMFIMGSYRKKMDG
jgi:hypothetical protein